jgi:hypothetical protein
MRSRSSLKWFLTLKTVPVRWRPSIKWFFSLKTVPICDGGHPHNDLDLLKTVPVKCRSSPQWSWPIENCTCEMQVISTMILTYWKLYLCDAGHLYDSSFLYSSAPRSRCDARRLRRLCCINLDKNLILNSGIFPCYPSCLKGHSHDKIFEIITFIRSKLRYANTS